MEVTRKDINPTLIPNTTMQKIFVDGVHVQYSIMPNKGYVLHDKRIDEEVTNPDTHEPTGEIIPRFSKGGCTMKHDYDFTAIKSGIYTYTDENGVKKSISVDMIGTNELYTIPENSAPAE